VVSGELRNFSRKLEVQMGETTLLIVGMVGDVAFLLNQNRSQGQMYRATHLSGRSMELLGDAIGRKAHAISEMRKKLYYVGIKLDRQVSRSARYASPGFLHATQRLKRFTAVKWRGRCGRYRTEVEER
jgi:hypothetical protein